MKRKRSARHDSRTHCRLAARLHLKLNWLRTYAPDLLHFLLPPWRVLSRTRKGGAR